MSNDNKAMRKLKLQVQMSVDGCIAGPNNETDWLTRGNDSFKYVNDIVDSSDTIILWYELNVWKTNTQSSLSVG